MITFISPVLEMVQKESLESGLSVSHIVNSIIAKNYNRSDLVQVASFRKPKLVKKVIHPHELPSEPVSRDAYRRKLKMTSHNFNEAVKYLLEGNILSEVDNLLTTNKEYVQ